MYAQLFYISEEDNHYPQTDKFWIDPIFENLLTIPEGHEGNNAYWNYTPDESRFNNQIGGLTLTDFNTSI